MRSDGVEEGTGAPSTYGALGAGSTRAPRPPTCLHMPARALRAFPRLPFPRHCFLIIASRRTQPHVVCRCVAPQDQEREVVEEDAASGRKKRRKVTELAYVYEPDMEGESH